MAPFAGWPTEAFTFYERLAADNSRTYWLAARPVYDAAVIAPMHSFAELVADEFGPLRVFRPHRDVRFSKDKTPYKTACGAMTEGEGGELYYVQLSAKGIMAGTGYYHLAGDQLERFRAAVDDHDAGAEIEGICEALTAGGYALGASGELKTAPRGYRRDHPRIALLRRKGLVAMRTFEPARWMSSPKAAGRIIDAWRGGATLNTWMNTHVGPSTLAPEDVWGG